MAQSVARRLGKAEVGGSSPLDSFEPFPATPVFTRNSEVCGVLFCSHGAFMGLTIKFLLLLIARFVCFLLLRDVQINFFCNSAVIMPKSF